jgi:uncharacterized protein (DUF1778 family)
MTGKNWATFNALLDSPAREIPALKRLAASGDVFRKKS